MHAISGPFPPTTLSSLRSKAGRSDFDKSAAGPSMSRPPPSRPPPGPPLDADDLSPSSSGMYTPTSEYSEPQYRVNSTRRPRSNYPPSDEQVYHPHRKYTDPTPQTGGQYSMHVPSSPLPSSSQQHQLDVDLDVYSQDYNDLEDDQRQPTLSFATTSTVDSSASSPSITDAYTYGPERGVEGGKYEQHEPRIRMRTGRQDAYSSAESSMASGAFSYHAYADNGYLNHAPPMPVAPSDIGLARNSEYTRSSSTEDASMSGQAQYQQAWRSPIGHRDRSESVSTSELTDSSAEDQLSVGFAHSFSYLSSSLPTTRRSWERGPAPLAEPNALAMVDDGRSAILDHAKLEAMGGAEAISAMSDDDLLGLPRFTHLLLSGVGADTLSVLPLLLDVLSTTLVVLDISSNDLASLPIGLRHCASLEELNVSNNPLRTLPSFIGDCTDLRMLAADNCMLQGLPSEVSQLQSIHTILLRNNRLVYLPTWLSMLPHLELLRIDNNPFAPQWMGIVAPILASTIAQSRSRSASYSHVRSPSQQSNLRGLTSGMNSLSTSQSSVAGPSSSTDSLALQNGARPGPGPVQSLRTQRFGSRSESPVPTRAPNRSVSGPTPASETFAGTELLSNGPLGKQRRVQSAAHYMTDESETESADLKASKWGFLRKVSLSRLRTEKDRAAQLSASAAANVASMPTVGPTISSPVLVGNMPRRPPLSSGWSTNMLPTRGSGAEQSDLNISTSSAPGSSLNSTIALPAGLSPTYNTGRTSRANKRRSFLPIDPSPPSLNVSIPSTSPFMTAQPILAEVEQPYIPAAEDAMETLGEESDSYCGPYSASSHTRPESDYSVSDEARYSRGLESIKSYLRDLHDLSLPPAEPYGGFEVLESTTGAADTLSPTGDNAALRASVVESNGSCRNNLSIEPTPSRSVSMVSSGSERYSKYSSSDSPDPTPTKRIKDDKGKRARVVREIFETEKTYVRGLSELVSIYVRPASLPSGNSKSSESVIPVAERKVVFNGVESILLFHRDNFLPALEKVVQPLMANGDTEDGATSALAAHQLGEIFRTYIAYMKQYSTYINNFDNALSRMKSWVAPPTQGSVSSPASSKAGSTVGVAALGAGLVGSAIVPSDVKPHSGAHLNPSQRKRVKHFLKRAKENCKHSQINLESYLLLPVQRVPRYKLLLEELAACTPPRETIGPNDALDDAILEITKLASLMNEEKREAESRLRLLHWQQRITSRGPSPLVQPHRKLVLDGALQLIRVVKKSSSFVEVDSSPTLQADGDLTITGTKAVIPVEYIKPEPMDKPIMLILCSDMLVLVQKRNNEGWDGQVDLFSVLRMATLREPASVSASNDRVLRVVDNRSIYYFNGGSHATTLQWCRAINQQNRR